MAEKAREFFYGWVVVFLLGLILALVDGLVINSYGQFIKPVCEAMGFSRGEFTLYATLQTLTIVVGVPFNGTVFKKINPRIVVIIAGIIVVSGWSCLSLAQNIIHFYIVGIFIGLGVSFIGTASINMFISNWFIKSKGTAIGFAMLGTGLGATFWNPLLSYLITVFGYQSAYRISGLIAFCSMIPFFIFFRFKPADMGLEPYGASETMVTEGGKIRSDPDAEGVMYKDAIKSPKFWALSFVIMSFPLCGKGFYTQLQPYFTDIGYTPVFAASLISIVSFFQACGKPVLGWLNDKLGIRRCFTIGTTFFFLGILFIMLSGIIQGKVIIYVAAFLFGCAMTVPTVISPLLTGAVFGRKDFINIYGTISSIWHLGPAIGPLLAAYVYDYTGSYQNAFISFLVIIVITFMVGQWLLTPNKKQVIRNEEKIEIKTNV